MSTVTATSGNILELRRWDAPSHRRVEAGSILTHAMVRIANSAMRTTGLITSIFVKHAA